MKIKPGWDYGGIDLSLTSIGLCRYRVSGEYETLNFGEEGITKLVGMERIIRLTEMANKIVDFVMDCSLVGIEGYSFHSKGQSSITLGEFGGLVRQGLCLYDVRFHEVPPKTLKKWTTGNGNADKVLMAVQLYKSYGVEFKTDDEADAYALSRLMECFDGVTECKNKTQTDAMAVLK